MALEHFEMKQKSLLCMIRSTKQCDSVDVRLPAVAGRVNHVGHAPPDKSADVLASGYKKKPCLRSSGVTNLKSAE